jgi:hypothetical protein
MLAVISCIDMASCIYFCVDQFDWSFEKKIKLARISSHCTFWMLGCLLTFKKKLTIFSLFNVYICMLVSVSSTYFCNDEKKNKKTKNIWVKDFP